MLIGILADSHDHAKPVAQAFELFDKLGVEACFHCGDVGGQRVLDLFVGRRIWFVWGNTDIPPAGIDEFLRAVGLPPPTSPLRVELAAKRIVCVHGHENGVNRLLAAPDADYLFYGHAHAPGDHRVGGCRLINPGALYRARTKTVATLDLATDDLQFHTVPHCEAVPPIIRSDRSANGH